MIALVGAMFVAMGSVGAVEDTNDRTVQAFGACVIDAGTGATNYLLVGDSCTIDIGANEVATSSDSTIVADPGLDESARSRHQLTALAVGSVTVTDTNDVAGATTNDDQTIKIEVLAAPTVSITFDDTDATVKAGTTVVATVTTRGFSANHTVTVSVPSTGLVITGVSPATGDDALDASFDPLPGGVTSTQIVVSDSEGSDWQVADPSLDGLSATVTIRTTGTPNGEYPVSASVVSQDADDDDGSGNTPPTDILIQKASTTATLTVGEAGAGLASATLSLGMRTATAEESGSDKAGGDGINLVLESFNSLGAKANSRDINTIIVSAIGSNNIAIGTSTSAQGALTVTEASASTDTVKQKHTVTVSKNTPGTVDVVATVIGASGVATTETISLTFSGNPDTHSVAAPADALAQEGDVFQPAVEAVTDTTPNDNIDQSVEAKEAVEGGLKFEVTGSDDAGNQSALTTAQITVRVLDADDKNVSSKFSITEEIKENSNGVVVVRVGTGAAKLDAGTYKLETKLTGKDTQMTDFSVSGAVAAIELSVDDAAPSIVGQRIEFTAMVTDENGNPVADGTVVTITASDVRGDGDSVLVLALQGMDHNSGTAETKNGEVSGNLVAVGAGSAVVTATSGAGFGVVVVESTAGASDSAMPEEEASVACLSNLAGFATWACGVESSASEIFGLVSGRGATALHLWNGSAWVRYSVVDGTMVPGSSDFMVAENDILYISN